MQNINDEHNEANPKEAMTVCRNSVKEGWIGHLLAPRIGQNLNLNLKP